MRHRGILALGLLALPLAGCAPLVEPVSWEQWASGHAAEADFTLYDGLMMGGSLDGGSTMQYGNDVFVDLPLDVDRIDLFCRSREPVTFLITDLEPVEVDCAEGASVELPVRSSTRIEASVAGRAYWLAVARPDAEAVSCEDCEADAFVDGEPVDGSVEESPEP